MKILYLSCHEILAYDEVALLTELGHDVFCPDHFVCEDNPGTSSLRPSILQSEGMAELMETWHTLGREGKDTKECLTVEFVKNFDVVILMHLPQWMHANWAVFKASRIPVIWRTIGQSISKNEKEMEPYRKQGLKIIRYSPRERTNPNYIGGDFDIRFYKDPEEYGGWTGDVPQVITAAQHMQKRDWACNYSLFEEITRPFERKLYGPGSEGLPFGMGKVSFEDLKSAFRDSRCYFYTGTHPASYTLNFIESMMTGIPIVAIGPAHGNAKYFPGHSLYEIGDIIKNGSNGFIADGKEELQKYVQQVLSDHDLAREISKKGRETAIKLFGKPTIKEKWRMALLGLAGS